MIVVSKMRQNLRILSARYGGDTSQFGERAIIEKYLTALKPSSNFVIDIGAMDGVNSSNTYKLFKDGCPGFLVEPNITWFKTLTSEYKTFAVQLLKNFATPDNVISIFKMFYTPKEPMFLNFDIDSYDFYVLDQILHEYRPSLVCAEINETIPPQYKFAVMPNSNIEFNWKNHFFGMNITMLGELCKKYSYDIVELNYINAFIIPHEKNIFKALTPRDAYIKGYQLRPDRKRKFSWNEDMNVLMTMDSKDGIDFINKKFEIYKGTYFLEVEDNGYRKVSTLQLLQRNFF